MQVGIDDDDGVSGGMKQSSRNSGLLTEVSGQRKHLPARFALVKRHERCQRVVRRSVVDRDDLPIVSLCHPELTRSAKTIKQQGKNCRLVEARNNNTDSFTRHSGEFAFSPAEDN